MSTKWLSRYKVILWVLAGLSALSLLFSVVMVIGPFPVVVNSSPDLADPIGNMMFSSVMNIMVPAMQDIVLRTLPVGVIVTVFTFVLAGMLRKMNRTSYYLVMAHSISMPLLGLINTLVTMVPIQRMIQSMVTIYVDLINALGDGDYIMAEHITWMMDSAFLSMLPGMVMGFVVCAVLYALNCVYFYKRRALFSAVTTDKIE